MGRKVGRRFYRRDAQFVAPDLLGLHLVVRRGEKRYVGRIVETEAYQGPEDRAAHSTATKRHPEGRRTPRTETMFGPAGHAYVYFVYGMHYCFNVVTQERGVPHAVLIRAVEPLQDDSGATNGPARLCKTFGIDRSFDGADLLGTEVYLIRPAGSAFRPPEVKRSARIGVDYAGSWAGRRWRFFDAGSSFVSRRR